MLALNQRFRLRETFAGLPFWSAVAFFIGIFLLCAAYMLPLLIGKIVLLVFAICSLAFGMIVFLTKDIRLFMDSIHENRRDLSEKFVGGDCE